MRHSLALVVAALLSAGIRSVDPPAPKLSDRDHLLLQTKLLTFRVAQLELEAVVKDLTVPGYLIDLQKLEYVKAPEKEKP
jgi:hypothetical protein